MRGVCKAVLAWAVILTVALTGCSGAPDATDVSGAPDATGTTSATGAADGSAEELSLSFENVFVPAVATASWADAEMTLYGDSFEDFYALADVVVLADVVDDDLPEYHEDLQMEDGVFEGIDMRCYSKLKVLSCYKGPLAAGEELIFSETGTRKDDRGEFSLNGVPVLRKNMRVLLFLEGPKKLANGEQGYVSVGAYEGEFLFDTAGRLHESAEFSECAQGAIANFQSPSYSEVHAAMNAIRRTGEVAH